MTTSKQLLSTTTPEEREQIRKVMDRARYKEALGKDKTCPNPAYSQEGTA